LLDDYTQSIFDVHGWSFPSKLGMFLLLPSNYWAKLTSYMTSQDFKTTQQLFKDQSNHS
jgi:hypothetical protein